MFGPEAPPPQVTPPVTDVLGVRVHALSMDDLHGLIRSAVARGERRVIANHNLHSVALYHRDPVVRAFYHAADFVHADGMALVAWGRLLGEPLRREHRVTYVDWIRPLMRESAARGWRVMVVGGRPGVAVEASRRLRAEIPGLDLRVTHGYFDTTAGHPESERVVRQVADVAPHLLMVGMGMPRQERWIHTHRERLVCNVVLPAGACMDYVAGAVPTPPRWMGRAGLEWLFRLACEPRRLAHRYAVEPWSLLGPVAQDVTRRVRGAGPRAERSD